MKLTQLKALRAIVKHDFSISEAANQLALTQPAISKQIQLLEAELKLSLFIRHGKRLTGLTDSGIEVHRQAVGILNRVDDLYQFSHQTQGQTGSLSIATTHTQARYVLPAVVNRFKSIYPTVKLELHQGSPKEVARLALTGEVDLAIATEAVGEEQGLVALPCYQWNRCVVTPKHHQLTQQRVLTLEHLAKEPIITYVMGYTGRHRIDEAFARAGLSSNIVLTAVDSDVIKTYVRFGLGVGVIANMAYNPEEDADLIAMDARDLFGTSYSHIALRKDKYLRPFIFKFIQMLAPHLTKELVMAVLKGQRTQILESLIQDRLLPVY